MHKIVNKKAPSYLTELIPDTVGNKARYPLRNSSNFVELRSLRIHLSQIVLLNGIALIIQLRQ